MNIFNLLISGISNVVSPYATALKIAGIAVIVAVIGGGLWYVSELKSNLVTSEMNNATLTQSIKTQKKVIAQQTADYKMIRNAQSILQRVSQNQRKKIKKLNDSFKIRANGTSRDFGAIARAKPLLIEHIINKATKETFKCAELIMTNNEVNNVCTKLIK